MIDPLSMNDAVIYKQFEGKTKSPSFIGVFVQGDRLLPLTFTATGPDEVYDLMATWLIDERGKLAKRESHLAYLRSEEAIAARKAASAARKAAKAAAE